MITVTLLLGMELRLMFILPHHMSQDWELIPIIQQMCNEVTYVLEIICFMIVVAHPGTRIVASFSYPYYSGYSPEHGHTNIITRLTGDIAGISQFSETSDFTNSP